MSEASGSGTKLRDAQVSAIVVSLTIVVFFVVYWGIQIQDVREMLKLAYG